MERIAMVYVVFVMFFLLSCKRENRAQEPLKDPFNWCDEKIACWGDSFTEGPGAISFVYQLSTILSKDSLSSAYNFYSKKNNEVVGFNGGISGQTSVQVRERFMKDTSKHSWATVIWSGTNNSWDTSQVINDIAAMIATLGHEKYVIIGILNGDFSDRWKGTAGYRTLTALNERLAKLYGRHFIDVKQSLQKFAQKNHADSLSLVHDVSPASLRLDQLHLTATGYHYVAKYILDRLTPCK